MINVFATPSRIPAMTCSGVWPTNSLSFASGSFSDASELNASTMSLMITAYRPVSSRTPIASLQTTMAKMNAIANSNEPSP